jgi:hypothetical protein
MKLTPKQKKALQQLLLQGFTEAEALEVIGISKSKKPAKPKPAPAPKPKKPTTKEVLRTITKIQKPRTKWNISAYSKLAKTYGKKSVDAMRAEMEVNQVDKNDLQALEIALKNGIQAVTDVSYEFDTFDQPNEKLQFLMETIIRENRNFLAQTYKYEEGFYVILQIENQMSESEPPDVYGGINGLSQAEASTLGILIKKACVEAGQRMSILKAKKPAWTKDEREEYLYLVSLLNGNGVQCLRLTATPVVLRKPLKNTLGLNAEYVYQMQILLKGDYAEY